jgi:hypothetical protein
MKERRKERTKERKKELTDEHMHACVRALALELAR